MTLQRGFDLPTQDRKPGTVPIISSSGVTGTHSESRVQGPGVVTGRYGTIGQVFYIEEDFWPLNTTLWVKDFKGNDPRFVSYLLQTLDFESHNDKSSVPGVNRNHLHLARVRKPPLPEQRAIARILGALDDKIELNRRMNATLEGLARALFQSWFVDFDPARAKAAGRQPAGLDAATAALFPDAFEDSALGEMPRGWRVMALCDAFEVNPPRAMRRGQIAPYLDMANMPTSSARAPSVAVREFGSGMRFANGDTLVARITPCLENGKTAFVDFLAPDQVGWGSTEYIVLRPKPPLPEEFAYFLARTDAFRSFAISNMTGTSGRQRVPAAALDHFMVAVPDCGVAATFGEFAREAFRLMKARDAEAATLAAMRNALLPRLLSGEVLDRSRESCLAM